MSPLAALRRVSRLSNGLARFGTLALVTAVVGLVGCQCCRLTDPWLRTVDHVSESGCDLQRLYCAGTDLTRLNKPGGNVGLNRMLCRGCNECGPTRDVPPPQFRVYPQPTDLAGSRESFDDREEETPLEAVELVPPEAVDEVQGIVPLPNTTPATE